MSFTFDFRRCFYCCCCAAACSRPSAPLPGSMNFFFSSFSRAPYSAKLDAGSSWHWLCALRTFLLRELLSNENNTREKSSNAPPPWPRIDKMNDKITFGISPLETSESSPRMRLMHFECYSYSMSCIVPSGIDNVAVLELSFYYKISMMIVMSGAELQPPELLPVQSDDGTWENKNLKVFVLDERLKEKRSWNLWGEELSAFDNLVESRAQV